MSSMRNAIQRRNHRERAQPFEREKWGVLEKHKDYSLRAKDYNEKKKRLRILKQKAAERNPDEFHFGMMSSKTYDKGQKLVDRGNLKLSQDAMKLLKTQDVGYVRTMAQKARRARERLEEDHILQGGTNADVLNRGTDQKYSRLTMFIEKKQQQDLLGSQNGIEINKSRLNLSLSQLSMGSYEIEYKQQTQSSQIDGILSSNPDTDKGDPSLKMERILRKQRRRNHEVRESRLKLLKLREGELLAAAQELELQRAKLCNIIGGTTRAGLKWKIRERKR